MPKSEEVQAVLDVLFNVASIRWDYELSMWREADRYYSNNHPASFKILRKKDLKRLYPEWGKRQFDEDFREIIHEALEQAERIRKERKKAVEVYPINVNLVTPSKGPPGKWWVELFMGTAGTECIEFDNQGEAELWIRNRAREHMEKKGVPKGSKILRIGGHEDLK